MGREVSTQGRNSSQNYKNVWKVHVQKYVISTLNCVPYKLSMTLVNVMHRTKVSNSKLFSCSTIKCGYLITFQCDFEELYAHFMLYNTL